MSVFRPRATTIGRIVFVAVLATPVALVGLALLYVRTPYFTSEGNPVSQPVQFDHRHHAGDDGIDCRYCHGSVTRSPSAGIPPAQLCMGCHNQIWNKSPLLEPVRRAYYDDVPIPWLRVNKLPDFVYFNHAIHVNKGIGCVSCHGRVDQMPAVAKAKPLSMSWCLDCHRNPEPHLRPLDRVFDLAWEPDDPEQLGRELARLYEIRAPTDCTACHR